MKLRVTSGVAVKPRRPAHEVLRVAEGSGSSAGSTFWKSLFSCPREHALRTEVGLRPLVTADNLTVGWLFHMALEEFYRAIQRYQSTRSVKKDGEQDFYFGGLVAAQKAAWDAVNPIADEEGYVDTWEELQRILAAYIDTYWGHDKWQILAVEENLEYHDEFSYTARLDLVIIDASDGPYVKVVEHKTAKIIGASLLQGYDMDLQILGQLWLMETCVDLHSLGAPFGGVMINITSKHKTPQFTRKEVLPSAAHLRSFEDSVREWHGARRYHASRGWPKALGHCSGFARGYSRCAFFDVCSGYPNHTVADWMEQEPPLGFKKGTE